MLIPDNIDSFDSTGEKLLYLKFKNDGSANGMYVLHSVFTNYHFNNISGELDFLVIVPNEGIFAVEVKHGKVTRENGTWYFENKDGNITAKKKSPFFQVVGTMYSIRTFILNKLENNKKLHERFSKFLWGTGVAFTSMNEFVDFGTEGYSWQILSRNGLRLPISNYINSLSKGWHKISNGKSWYDVNLSRPSDEDCKTLIRIIRGDFDINYSDLNRIMDYDNLIEEYTKEQFHLLDFVKYNDRCLIEGNAGTGKTLMAIEIARREIIAGKKIGLFCYNNMLGQKLSSSIHELFKKNNYSFYAGSFHGYLTSKVLINSTDSQKDDHKYYSEELPFEFLIENENITESQKFDYIIIDEAQDLIFQNYIEVFDLILKGGIKKGKWIFLGDFSNQAIYLNKPDTINDLLKSSTSFTRFPPLKINCRNSKKIAYQNTLLTGVDKPEFTSRNIEGDSIDNRFIRKDLQQKVIEDILKELVEKNIPLTKITLLSPKKIENSIINESEYICHLFTKGLFFSTIQAFKGLENTFIILFDFDEISTIESKRLLYIGISRARQKLFIVLNKNLEDDYQQLIKTNIGKLN